MMRKPVVIWVGVAFTAVVNLSCTESPSTLDPSEDVGASESPIINGYIDDGHPSVGLVHPPGCTATLVGRRTALTAAHCLDFSGQRKTFCTDGHCLGGTAYRHPAYDPYDADVAVVLLDGDFYAAFGTIPTRLSGSRPSENTWVVPVGYGCTVWTDEDSSTGYGTKRYGYAQIKDVDSGNFQWDSQSRICPGDSGGPTFNYLSDCQIGVHSHRQDFFHGSDDVDMRVDVYQGWMRAASADPSVLSCGETICGDGICHPGEVGCDCAPTPPPVPPGYQGCFTDDGNRALPASQGGGYSLQACFDTCASQGYAYAGSQWYDQCFCGNSLGYSGVSDAECNTPCLSGGGYCGGGWRNSIYATGVTPPPGGGAMQADSAVRGCSNASWWAPVFKPDAASCSSYCVENGANSCEWYAGNGDCYVEFASGGCYVASGFAGWHAVVY